MNAVRRCGSGRISSGCLATVCLLLLHPPAASLSILAGGDHHYRRRPRGREAPLRVCFPPPV